ncbi:MAG TPA: hypothetical protein VFL62_10920, partial [Bradyrhizobium sp.]|nr:hypothetical protein [Bradyrhizobium sp.]
MKRSETAIVTLMLMSQMLLPAAASPLVMAQTQAAPSAAPAAPATPPTTVAPAEKSALSIPACSVKYLEAKVAGKLQGRKWVDFRREECGRHETTAVFPTAISPKYESEKDL